MSSSGQAIAAWSAGGKASDVFDRKRDPLGAACVICGGLVCHIDQTAHLAARHRHFRGTLDAQSRRMAFLADAEHGTALVDATQHMSVQHETQPAEHPLFFDHTQTLQITPHDLGQSFVISHRVSSHSKLCIRAGVLVHLGLPAYERAISQPHIILVRPQMGENIGAAARAMWNFGLDRMTIVAPRDGWPNSRAVAMASGAGRLLDEAQLFETTAQAIGEASYVYATTARSRDLTKEVFTPEAAMQDAAARIAAGQKVAVLFGPERAGLENDDIARANAIISVPVNPEFPSLNLAQCVLLTGYEWQRATSQTIPREMGFAGTEPATHIEIEKLGDHFEDRLDEAGYFYPEDKAEGMKLVLRNMWTRLALTRADIQMLHGMMRQMVRWKTRGD